MTEIVAAAKRLGWLAQPDFCPQCFQLKHALGWKPPWNVFPGCFGLFDLAQKAYVTGYLDTHGALPPSMQALGDITGYIPSPHMKDFYFKSVPHEVHVRGEADLILRRRDSKLVIVDLKTSKDKGGADTLWPTYCVQANAYARAAQERGLGDVEALAVVYMGPVHDFDTMQLPENHRDDGIAIPFKATVRPISMASGELDDLCGRYRQMCDAEELLDPYPGCPECEKVRLLAEFYNERRVTPLIQGLANGEISFRRAYASI